MVFTDESVVVAVTVESTVQISARAWTAYCWARPASSSLAMRCCASNPIAAFLSFLLALYFLSACDELARSRREACMGRRR